MDGLMDRVKNLIKCAPTFGPVLKELSDEIERLRNEVAELRKASGWRPIETYRNGDVLLYYPKHIGRNPISEWVRVGTPSDTPRRKPTHWFLIPKPPAVEGE